MLKELRGIADVASALLSVGGVRESQRLQRGILDFFGELSGSTIADEGLGNLLSRGVGIGDFD